MEVESTRTRELNDGIAKAAFAESKQSTVRTAGGTSQLTSGTGGTNGTKRLSWVASVEGMSQFFGESEDKPVTVVSRMSIARPQTHRLPTPVIWGITLSSPIIIAVINYVIVITQHYLDTVKFEFMQDALNEEGAIVGAFVLACCCMTLALGATLLVTYVGPLCAGSGVPEAKGYLNGNSIVNFFSFRNLFVRVIGITLACAAGYPVGREGPMVCIGGSVGVLVVQVCAGPYVRKWIDVHTQGQESDINPALIVDEERFAHAKRIGCALGGAAGIAAAFNAPIGGILYMFEEVTVTSWPPELTFRAFAACVLAAMIARGLLNASHSDVHALVMFDDNKSQDNNSWNWEDVPFFVLLAIFVGLFSAFMTKCMLAVWSARDRFKKAKFMRSRKKEIKAIEAVLYAAVVAIVFCLVPLAFACMEAPVLPLKDDPQRRLASAGARFVRHDCAEGEHREVATLLLTGAEEAVKHLFSRHASSDMSLRSLAVAAGAYSVLAIGMPGLPVPMGCFVPCLLIGAMLGRFVGEAVAPMELALAHPGVYALLGSAAMLSGFTHMTIAIVVLLIEAAADLSLVSPIMLCIFISSLLSKLVLHHAYDEVLILRKGVPFLDAEVPHEMEDGVTAGDLCDEYPPECVLAISVPATDLIKALDYGNKVFQHFPVVECDRCIGLTTRSRLEAAVAAVRRGSTNISLNSGGTQPFDKSFGLYGQSSLRTMHEEDKDLGIQRFVSGLAKAERDSRFSERTTGSTIQTADKTVEEAGGNSYPSIGDEEEYDCTQTESLCWDVPIWRFMDQSPHMLCEDMPAPRFYGLFIKAGVTAAAVVSKQGHFLGVLSRSNLISQCRVEYLPEPMRCHSHTMGNSATNFVARQVSGQSESSASSSTRASRQTELIKDLQVEISKLKASNSRLEEELEEERESSGQILGTISKRFLSMASKDRLVVAL